MSLSQLTSAKTGASLEQLLASFDATAAELTLHHGMRPSDLSARMRGALEAASAGLPKLPVLVLYCASYSWYFLEQGSKFLSFLRSTSSLSPCRAGRTLVAYESDEGGDREEDMEGNGDVLACPQFQPCATQHSSILPQPSPSPVPMQEDETAAPAQVPTLATLCILARMSSSDSRPGTSSMASTYVPGGCSAVDRVLDAHMLIPFGRALAAEWPYVTRLLRAYRSPGGAECREHYGAAEQLVSSREQLARATAMLKRLAAALAPGAGWEFGGRGWTPNLHTSAGSIRLELDQQDRRTAARGLGDAGRLTHAAVEEMRLWMDEDVSRRTSDAAAMAAALAAVPFADAMLATASARAAEAAAGQRGEGRRDEERWLSFSQAVAQLGEQHPRIWASQQSFDKGVMQHLLRCPQHVSQLLLQQGEGQGAADEELLLELAVCAGSARGCCLRVHLVPQLCEWCIDECDGMESVRMV